MGQCDENFRRTIPAERFSLWRTLLRDLEMTAEEDHTLVHFLRSSTYLFSTGRRTFWMMDPCYSVGECDPGELKCAAELISAKISFIVITHLHPDHCQMSLTHLLKDSPVRWVVPRSCTADFLNCSGIPAEKVISLAPGESTELEGICIAAFSGYHREPGIEAGVPSGSYAITLPDGIRLFFPSDIRDYRAQLPPGETDFIFGHVFLGRVNATGDDFPLLDDFCRFMTQKKSRTLILTHLYEISRESRDLWTCRHAAMIRDRIKAFAPDLNVEIPRFGSSLHLVKDPARFRDPFLYMSGNEREDFLDHLGVSLKKDHEAGMERAIENRIPVVEWMTGRALEVPRPVRNSQLARWREAGGRVLSIHFPDFPLNGASEENFAAAVEMALENRADRITVHVPGLPLGEVNRNFADVTSAAIRLCRPLLKAGISVGIENLHMTPAYAADDSRPFGFTPPECLRLTETLRRETGSPLWGIHLDIGHAYSNAPYTAQYDTEAWLRLCGNLINGMHLHQFEHVYNSLPPFGSGHRSIVSRNTGHPSLLPVFAAWHSGAVRVPMILEIARGDEPEPFSSLARLRRNPFPADDVSPEPRTE